MKMDRDRAYMLIDGSDYVVMALAVDQNHVYSLPINIVRAGDIIYFHCGMKGRKIEIIKENGIASFTVVDNVKIVPEKLTSVYESVIFDTKIEFVTENEEKISALKSLCKKFAPDYMPDANNCILKGLDGVLIGKGKLSNISLKVKFINENNKIEKYTQTV